MIEVEPLVNDLWIFFFRKALLVWGKREMLEQSVACNVIKAVMPFEREIRRSYHGARRREIGAVFGEQFPEHSIARFLGQAGQDERRRLGQRAAYAVYSLALLVQIDTGFVWQHLFCESDCLCRSALFARLGGEQNLCCGNL